MFLRLMYQNLQVATRSSAPYPTTYAWKLDLRKLPQKFAEKRLLKHPEHKHKDAYQYKCSICNFRSKWPTPYK